MLIAVILHMWTPDQRHRTTWELLRKANFQDHRRAIKLSRWRALSTFQMILIILSLRTMVL